MTQAFHLVGVRRAASAGAGIVRVWAMMMALSLAIPCAFAFVVQCVPVEGDRILGKHLAVADARFTALDPTVDLGPAPMAAAERIFRVPELTRLAQKYSIAPEAAVPSGVTKDGNPDAVSTQEVCFRRVAQMLTKEQLLPVLQTALQNDRPSLDVMGSQAKPDGPQAKPEGTWNIEILDFSRNALPEGRLEFQRRDLSAVGLWRGHLVYGAGRSVPLWVRVKVTDLASGEPIAIWQGSGHSLSKPEVERGQAVQVEVARGAVHLGFEAAAESSGHIGEAVVLRNPANGKRVRGIVTAEGKVVIHP